MGEHFTQEELKEMEENKIILIKQAKKRIRFIQLVKDIKKKLKEERLKQVARKIDFD